MRLQPIQLIVPQDEVELGVRLRTPDLGHMDEALALSGRVRCARMLWEQCDDLAARCKALTNRPKA